MPIIVTCECGKEFQTRDENADGHARCPDCGREPMISQKGESAPRVAEIMTGNAASSKVIKTLALCIAALFFCVFLLWPAVAASFEASRRSQCVDNLKRIGSAIHDYVASSGSAAGKFPPAAIVDGSGKPLLSWRVTILPFVGEQSLYNEFHLNEPWDSPHNKALLPRMPAVYRCPSEPWGDPSLTNYQVIVGPHTMFEEGQVVTYREITDGTSNTILVAESKYLVPWTKPEDLVFDPDGPLPAFGSRHSLGFNSTLADGSVKFIKFSWQTQILKGVITRDGGEVLSNSCY